MLASRRGPMSVETYMKGIPIKTTEAKKKCLTITPKLTKIFFDVDKRQNDGKFFGGVKTDTPEPNKGENRLPTLPSRASRG